MSLLQFDLGQIDEIKRTAEDKVSGVDPQPAAQSEALAGQLDSLNSALQRVETESKRMAQCPYSKEKEAEAESQGTDTRGWEIGRALWYLVNGELMQTVVESLNSLRMQFSSMFDWLEKSNLQNLYAGPRVLLDAATTMRNAEGAATNAVSHLQSGDVQYLAEDWVVAGTKHLQRHSATQVRAAVSLAAMCGKAAEQLENYAIALHVAYSAVSNLVATVTLQFIERASALISAAASKDFKGAASEAIGFISTALEGMQGILDSATNLYREQVKADSVFKQSSLDGSFPGQEWPKRTAWRT